MAAASFLLFYLLCGVSIIHFLLPTHKPLTRWWLGLSLGLFLFMWLPALMAFSLKFTKTAHYVSLIPLVLLTAAAYFFRDKRSHRPWDAEETTYLKILLCIALPLTILGGYLQYTHNLRIASDGSYHVGQSTYGDLPLHTAILTGLRDASFPPDYSILPGELLTYPFLMDSLSTSLYLFGFSLQLSLVIPGTLMMALCFAGYILMVREMAGSRRALILATLLFFLNGGLGFLYTFDRAAGDWKDRIFEVLNGFYKTPTNQPDPYNLRWSNVIADLMVPQRTILSGWTMVMPCIYLLFTAFSPWKRQESSPGFRQLLLLGVWAGGLPLIHTHSFLALGLMSGGFLLYTLLHRPSEKTWRSFLSWLLYGGITLALALPQLIGWTFSRTSSSEDFLKPLFNWVNNNGNGGLIDFYLWFYLKNIGLPVILLLCALLEKNPRHRFLAAGAFVIFLVAEFFRFQPNEYDNNKLFYVWYMICAVLAADYGVTIFDRLRGLRGRYLLAAFTGVALFLSAGLTLWREVVSDYQAYSKTDIEAAAFIEEKTPAHAVFLAGYQYHINPVSSLAGRTIVCGPDTWLHYHGFDISERAMDIERFYADPNGNLDVLSKYKVEYIFLSSNERSDMPVDYEGLEKLFPLFYTGENGEISVYEVPPAYRAVPEG